MATSFFRKLRALESAVNSVKFNSTENVFSISPDDIRKHLRKLIRFTEDAILARNDFEIFLCRNFRDKNDKLLRDWNKLNNTNKSSSTLRVQLRTLSKKFYSVFGENFDDFYYNGNIEAIQKYSDTCDALRIEASIDLPSMFIDELYKMVSGTNEGVYSIDECKNELILLRCLMKSNIIKNIKSVNIDKLCYILNNLNNPIIGTDSQNLNNVKIWLLSHLFSLQKSDTSVQKIPLLDRGKKHITRDENISQNEINMVNEEVDKNVIEENNFDLNKTSYDLENTTNNNSFTDNNDINTSIDSNLTEIDFTKTEKFNENDNSDSEFEFIEDTIENDTVPFSTNIDFTASEITDNNDNNIFTFNSNIQNEVSDATNSDNISVSSFKTKNDVIQNNIDTNNVNEEFIISNESDENMDIPDSVIDSSLQKRRLMFAFADKFQDYVDYIRSNNVPQLKLLTQEEKKSEYIRIGKFFKLYDFEHISDYLNGSISVNISLYNLSTILDYLKSQNYNVILFTRALEAYNKYLETMTV